MLRRLALAYGSLAPAVLGDAGEEGRLGRPFGAGLYQREVEYLMRHEWARCAEDVLWRRGKLGLLLDDSQAVALQEWMQGWLQHRLAPAGDPAARSRPVLD